jgi:hypothetical protein
VIIAIRAPVDEARRVFAHSNIRRIDSRACPV